MLDNIFNNYLPYLIKKKDYIIYLVNMDHSEMVAQIINNEKMQEAEQKCLLSPQKRRGRPQKKPQPFFEQGQQLFTIHDNIFHVAILFYTFRVFDKAPTRKRFNPTIGFSVYEKVKGLDLERKKYYDNDEIAELEAEQYQDNFHLVHFFKNSMTFGPRCVIDQFFQIFHFILSKLRDNQQVTLQMCLDFMHDHKIRYINFENEVLDFLEAKTTSIRQGLRQVIATELCKLLQILIHVLECLNKRQKENKYSYILESEQNMFERGIHSKTKKKVKKQ